MIDYVAIGALFVTVVTALGLRDLLKLYVNRHEGCGKAKCRAQMNQYASNAVVIKDLK